MKATPTFPIPVSIRRKLSELRGIIGRVIAFQGATVLGIWMLSAFWLFGALDYFPVLAGAAESPKLVRMAMLAVFVVGILLILYRYFWERWLVHWSNSTLALAIERLHPEFQSSLVTTVQAAERTEKDEIDHPNRAGVLELARIHAEKCIANIDVRSLVQFRTLRQELTALGIITAFSLIFLAMYPGWTKHWSSRLLSLSDTPWPRQTELGLIGVELDIPSFTGKNARERYAVPFDGATVRVPKGQACQLRTWARQVADTKKEVFCTVYYRDSEGVQGRANMRQLSIEKDKHLFALDGPPFEGLQESLSLTLTGGDNRISGLTVDAVESPLVTQLDLDVTYPSYLQRSTKTVWGNERVAYRNGLRLPQGSQLELVIRTNKPIQRFELALIGSGESVEDRFREVSIPLDKPSTEVRYALGKLEGNILVEARLWDTNGICSTRVQQFVIAAIKDLVPQIDFVLKGIGSAVTENAIVTTSSSIRDDYDVKSAWIEAVLDETPAQKNELEVPDDGMASKKLDLKEMRENGSLVVKVGSSLSLMVAAEDFLDLEESPHIGRSSPIHLNVVTPDQLLILLERRELAMRARLEQIISELGQLRDLLTIMSKSTQAVETAVVPQDENAPKNAESEDAESNLQRKARLQLLRAQQSSAQGTKSEGELRGVEVEISQIIAELINNRVDNKDRRQRLEEKIRDPLRSILANEWVTFAKQVHDLEKQVPKESDTANQKFIGAAIESDNRIIAQLQQVLDAMTDIEDFNELLDMVRDMIDQQVKLQEQTKNEKKKIDLELLK